MGTVAVFVHLAVGLSSIALIRTWVVFRRSLPPADSVVWVHDVHEAAFLGGGPARVVDTALAVMHGDGRLLIGGPGVVVVQNPLAQDPVERAVLDRLALAPNGSLAQVRGAVMHAPEVQGIGDGLAARGLMSPPHRRRAVLNVWGVAQGTLCSVAIPVSFVLTLLGHYALGWERPALPFVVLVLPALIAGIVSGFLVAARARARITKAGRTALEAYRTQYAKEEAPALLVALKGPRGLSDQGLRTTLVAAAVAPAVFLVAAGGGVAAAASAPAWCGSVSGTSCGEVSGTAGDGGGGCGGDGGGGGGGSCGGCGGGCGCG